MGNDLLSSKQQMLDLIDQESVEVKEQLLKEKATSSEQNNFILQRRGPSGKSVGEKRVNDALSDALVCRARDDALHFTNKGVVTICSKYPLFRGLTRDRNSNFSLEKPQPILSCIFLHHIFFPVFFFERLVILALVPSLLGRNTCFIFSVLSAPIFSICSKGSPWLKAYNCRLQIQINRPNQDTHTTSVYLRDQPRQIFVGSFQ